MEIRATATPDVNVPTLRRFGDRGYPCETRSGPRRPAAEVVLSDNARTRTAFRVLTPSFDYGARA
jgi:hypothetical protein